MSTSSKKTMTCPECDQPKMMSPGQQRCADCRAIHQAKYMDKYNRKRKAERKAQNNKRVGGRVKNGELKNFLEPRDYGTFALRI